MGEKRKAIAAQVYEYMRAHPGEALYLSAISQEIDRDPGSVSTTLGRFAAMADTPIERVQGPDGPVRGLYIWRVNGTSKAKAESSKPTRAIYEYIGTIRDGSVIVQAESGELFKLAELQ
jgi:hypothetical protein